MHRAQDHHQQGVGEARSQVERLRRQSDRLSVGRGLAFVGAGALGIAAWAGPLPWWPSLGVSAVFVSLVVAQVRVGDRVRRVGFVVEHHERSLARLAGHWPGTGPDGSAWRESGHPYQPDLDIVGPGSLFQLLCAARTRGGQARLASWLSNPSDPEALVARQGAVEELSAGVAPRQRMAVTEAGARMDLDAEDVSAWARQPHRLALLPWRIATATAGLGLATSLAGWLGLGWSPWWLVAAMAVGYTLHAVVSRRLAAVAGRVQRPAAELGVLSALMVEVEAMDPTHPYLRALRERLGHGGGTPSRRIAALRRRLEALDWDRNLMFGPIAALVLWRAQWTLAVEAWRRRHATEVVLALEVLAEVEALQSLARHAFEHPADTYPTLASGEPCFEAVGLGHPLLTEDQVVRNDVALDARCRLLVVSGSNMSGKSTLLRAIGANVVLALAGGVVRATSLRLTPMAVGASIRAEDSLLAGASRFRAELDRMRVVLALTRGPLPLLFLLDEIFHGTHSHDRQRGAQGFLARLLERGALGLVTTHDLALTRLQGTLAEVGTNVHFQDDVVGGQMTFDYTMRPGVVEKSNALALMAAEGLIEPDPEASGTLPSDAPS